MSAHDHHEYAPGCFRCELSRDEVGEAPFVAIGAGERAPWEDLSLLCPTCGEGPLRPRRTARYTYITHCNGTWLRGPVASCSNCDDRKCMSCIFREVHDVCRDDCPKCCP